MGEWRLRQIGHTALGIEKGRKAGYPPLSFLNNGMKKSWRRRNNLRINSNSLSKLSSFCYQSPFFKSVFKISVSRIKTIVCPYFLCQQISQSFCFSACFSSLRLPTFSFQFYSHCLSCCLCPFLCQLEENSYLELYTPYQTHSGFFPSLNLPHIDVFISFGL